MLKYSLVVLGCVGLVWHGFANVQVTGLENVQFGVIATPPNQDLKLTQGICIYNSAGTNYKITLSGNYDNGTNFHMNSEGNLIAYTAEWKGDKGASEVMKPGFPLAFTGAGQADGCADIPDNKRAKLTVIVDKTSFSPFPPAGTYADTLTILLEPN